MDTVTLDLPLPPSTNRIWRYARGRVYKPQLYVKWLKQCDALLVANRQYPREKIFEPFTVHIELAKHRGDGDNRIKAILDYLQSREIIRNDSDCQGGSWQWVSPLQAPFGCRVHITTCVPTVVVFGQKG